VLLYRPPEPGKQAVKEEMRTSNMLYKPGLWLPALHFVVIYRISLSRPVAFYIYLFSFFFIQQQTIDSGLLLTVDRKA
jgi:hypothetical protein